VRATTSHVQAHEVIRAAAELAVPAAQIDHSIRTYMSGLGER